MRAGCDNNNGDGGGSSEGSVSGEEDKAGGDEGEEDFAEDADEDGTPTLVDEVADVGAEADAGERGKEDPLGEIAERGELRGREEAGGGEDGDRDEAEDELGKLLPEEERLVLDVLRLPAAGPVDGVAEDNEADEGRARGFGEDGDAAGFVTVERAGDGGLGSVVDGEAGPEAVTLLAHVQRVADGGECEECDRAEGEDGGDGGRGVPLFRVDGALCGHDGGDSADGAADGEEAGEFGPETEDAAEQHHDGEREDELDGDEDERETAEMEEIAEDELCADEDNAEFEPEFVGGETGAEECGKADGVADSEAEKDGPEDVLDLREGDVARGAQVVAE